MVSKVLLGGRGELEGNLENPEIERKRPVSICALNRLMADGYQLGRIDSKLTSLNPRFSNRAMIYSAPPKKTYTEANEPNVNGKGKRDGTGVKDERTSPTSPRWTPSGLIMM